MTVQEIFALRKQGRNEEAAKIYKALQRVLPNITDSDGRAKAFMDYAHHRLEEVVNKKDTLNFQLSTFNFQLNKGQQGRTEEARKIYEALITGNIEQLKNLSRAKSREG